MGAVNILAIETSTELCSVALLRGEELFVEEEMAGNRHSEVLPGMLRRLLRRAGDGQRRRSPRLAARGVSRVGGDALRRRPAARRGGGATGGAAPGARGGSGRGACRAPILARQSGTDHRGTTGETLSAVPIPQLH